MMEVGTIRRTHALPNTDSARPSGVGTVQMISSRWSMPAPGRYRDSRSIGGFTRSTDGV